MKNITKKLLISVISLGLLASISVVPNYTSNIDVNAKVRIHYYRRRVVHKLRHRRRAVRHRRTVRHHFHKIRLKSYSSQMAHQTLNNINRDRRSYGISPIKETNQLNRLASIRARQLIRNFSHYDNYGRTYYLQDAKRMYINLNHYHHNRSANGENIANAGLDYGDVAYTNMPNDPHKYVNKNGYDMANMDNDAMFNYDSGSNWGHRKNILNKNFHYVGIGVARKGNTYFLAEDFDS